MLFGVRFAQLRRRGAALSPLPLGLAGDPGGLPRFDNGRAEGQVVVTT